MAGLPSSIEGMFKALDDQTTFLSNCLAVYIQIFYSPQQKKGMLDQVAGSAFVVIEKALWSEILMLINRLADHAGKPNEKRLCFERLYSEIGGTDADLSRKLRKTWRTIEGIRTEVKRDRNTYLAHIALKHAQSGALRRDIIRPAMVKKAIQTFQDFMLIVLNHYHPDRTFTYDSELVDGGDDLIAVIEDGLHYRELQKQER